MTRTPAQVRNPVLGLASMAAILELEPECRAALAGVLLELRAEAQAKADESWRRHKAPMAAYWKAVAVYAGHIARATRTGALGERLTADELEERTRTAEPPTPWRQPAPDPRELAPWTALELRAQDGDR